MSTHLLNNVRAQLLRNGAVKPDPDKDNPVREARRLKGLLVVRRLDAVLSRRSMVHQARG